MSILKRNKNIGIGYMKSFLTLSMIFAHLIQFISPDKNLVFSSLSIYVNLITFSAFFFCFGYLYQIAYFSGPDDFVSRKKIFRGFYKTLFSFYISAIFYRVIKTDGWKLDFKNILSILLLRDIPVYSEFLLAFSLISFCVVIFYKYVKDLLSNKLILILSTGLFLTYYIVPRDLSNYSGLFFGSYSFALFPVVCYFPFFLFGSFMSEKRENFSFKILIISTLFSFSFVYYIYQFDQLPSRFPPSPFWLAGAVLPIYIYYNFFCWLGRRNISPKLNEILGSIGNNSLFYLLMSNIMIFIFSKQFNSLNQPSILKIVLVYLFILSCIYYLTRIVRS